jgi:hypothetical protein
MCFMTCLSWKHYNISHDVLQQNDHRIVMVPGNNMIFQWPVANIVFIIRNKNLSGSRIKRKSKIYRKYRTKFKIIQIIF